MSRRQRTTIGREGIYYLLVVAFVVTGAVLREVNLLLVVAGMMLFPFLLNWRTVVVGMRDLTVRRRFPEAVRAGDLLVVDIELRKQPKRLGRRSSTGRVLCVRDRIEVAHSRELVAEPTLMFWQVAPGKARRLRYRGRIARRGRYRLGPLLVSSRFPLGLVQRTVEIPASDTVFVLPRQGHLTRGWSRLYSDARTGARTSRQKHGLLEGDFHSLRDWRPGDSLRRIHWRTTARRGSPVVRQFERRTEQDLMLLVDLWQPRPAARGDLRHVERAVSFAATVAEDVCERGNSELSIGVAGQQLRSAQGAAAPALLREVMQILAEAEASTQPPLPELLRKAVAAARPGMLLLLISPRRLALGDAQQFAEVTLATGPRGAARQIMTIHTGRELSEFFVEPGLAGRNEHDELGEMMVERAAP